MSVATQTQTIDLASPTSPLPPDRTSWLQFASKLPDAERETFLATFDDLDLDLVAKDWWCCARREQLPPDHLDWFVWVLLAGRGFGKTRSGAEFTIWQHRHKLWTNSALVGATSRDVRRFMLEGESGILSVCPNDFRPIYKKADMQLNWPNGTVSHIYTAKEPERLRGPNHDGAWCDEFAAWARIDEAWDNLEMTLRKAASEPRVMITTTPKPRSLLRKIIADPDTVTTGGSTYENTPNLSRRWLDRMIRRYEGTRTGRQELYAHLLSEAEGALWARKWFDDNRLRDRPDDISRIVVGVDPPAVDAEDASECGIVVAGTMEGFHGCVLDDRSTRGSPDEWAREAILAYFKWRANVLVAERNNGGDMVKYTIETTAQEMRRKGLCPDEYVNVEVVWASHGKAARAEPISAMYQQGRIHHYGAFTELEDQCCNWVPNSGDRSPDRLDALVWAFTYLMVDNVPGAYKDEHFIVGSELESAHGPGPL